MKFDDYWKVPKDSKKYFSPKKEKELKEKYGVFYTLHTILCVAILIIPFLFSYFWLQIMRFRPLQQVVIYVVLWAAF